MIATTLAGESHRQFEEIVDRGDDLLCTRRPLALLHRNIGVANRQGRIPLGQVQQLCSQPRTQQLDDCFGSIGIDAKLNGEFGIIDQLVGPTPQPGDLRQSVVRPDAKSETEWPVGNDVAGALGVLRTPVDDLHVPSHQRAAEAARLEH